jgi:para-nitrobenzyl esterase
MSDQIVEARYGFDWESPAFGGVLGAAHVVEIPFVWNRLDTEIARRFTGDSPTRQPLADLMHASWAAFIRSVNPTIASLPTWPPYDLERRATMIFSDVAPRKEELTKRKMMADISRK